VERACVRPPDYEFQIGNSTGLHRFVCVCTSLSYFTLNVKYYTGLHDFVDILAPNWHQNTRGKPSQTHSMEHYQKTRNQL
jgi:hypothetical protein